MKKFSEWFNNGGKDILEGFLYVLGIIVWIFFIALLASCIRNLPLFFEYVAKTLLSLGEV